MHYVAFSLFLSGACLAASWWTSRRPKNYWDRLGSFYYRNSPTITVKPED